MVQVKQKQLLPYAPLATRVPRALHAPASNELNGEGLPSYGAIERDLERGLELGLSKPEAQTWAREPGHILSVRTVSRLTNLWRET